MTIPAIAVVLFLSWLAMAFDTPAAAFIWSLFSLSAVMFFSFWYGFACGKEYISPHKQPTPKPDVVLKLVDK